MVAEAERFACACLGMAVCDVNVSGSVAPKPAKFLTRPARPDNDTNLPLAGATRSADRVSSALLQGPTCAPLGVLLVNLTYLPFQPPSRALLSRQAPDARVYVKELTSLACMRTRLSVPPIAKSVDRVHRAVFERVSCGLVIWLKAFWLKGKLTVPLGWCLIFEPKQ